MAVTDRVPAEIADILLVPTPASWIDAATGRLPELLVDHANCELKAASTALGFIYRYPERNALCQRMSRLAREELRHYEQLRKIMERMSIPYRKLSASRYAGELRECVRQNEPDRLTDSLIVGALIEARSCERFAALIPHLPSRLAEFYAGLLKSEARHFADYLAFAKRECEVVDDVFALRLAELQRTEAQLVTEPDRELRFHSGIPV